MLVAVTARVVWSRAGSLDYDVSVRSRTILLAQLVRMSVHLASRPKTTLAAASICAAAAVVLLVLKRREDAQTQKRVGSWLCWCGHATTRLGDWPELRKLRYVADGRESDGRRSVLFVSPASFRVPPIWFKIVPGVGTGGVQWFWKPYTHKDCTWIPVAQTTDDDRLAERHLKIVRYLHHNKPSLRAPNSGHWSRASAADGVHSDDLS